MLRLRHESLPHRGSSHQFVGADQGDVGVSVFLFRGEAGSGPGPHRHPYDEIQFVQGGRGRWTVAGKTFEAGAGDVLVIKAGEVHAFTAIGDEPLVQLDVHVAPRFVQEEVAPDAADAAAPPAARADAALLDVLLDSWDRNAAILVGLLRLLPPGGLDARATPDGPTVAALLAHVHYVRLVLVAENAAECAREVPADEWAAERDPARMAARLAESAAAVREAVRGRVAAGRDMAVLYDHPILLVQHLVWHEGYHHGQIKVALKAAGLALPDDVAGPATWDVWMDRRTPPAAPMSAASMSAAAPDPRSGS